MSAPILIPLEREEFWAQIRLIIREEVSRDQKELTLQTSMLGLPGLTEKPLYKIQEICSLFGITKPTVHDWIDHGKLKRLKIRSRVYFLGSDVRQLMQA